MKPAEVLALMQPKRSKFNVDRSAHGKAKRTLDGVVYDSEAEMNYSATLLVMKRAGTITDFERQVHVPLVVNSVKVAEMFLDFRVTWPDGRKVLIDVKGVATAEWTIKRKLYEALTGDKIVVVHA